MLFLEIIQMDSKKERGEKDLCYIDRYKLTVACMRNNMTLKDLSKKSGYSYTWIKKIRQGSSCSSETLQDIADTLNVSVSWLERGETQDENYEY